jgi:hypothetical protein
MRTGLRKIGGSGWRRAERNATEIAEITATRGKRIWQYVPADIIERRKTYFRRTRVLPRSNNISLFVYRYYRDPDIIKAKSHWWQC